MSRSQAARSGFTAVLRRPELYFAELMWRWALYAAGWLVGAYALLGFLDSLPVSDAAFFGLYNFVPGSRERAWESIFHGSGPRLILVTLSATIGITVLWWMAASLGRSATLAALMPGRALRLDAVFRLNGLRAILATMALLAYAGAFALATSYSRIKPGNHEPAKFYLALLPLLFLTSVAWSSISWHLTLTPIVSLRTGRALLASLHDAAVISRRQATQFIWIGFAYGLLRMATGIFGGFVFFVLLSAALDSTPEIALGVIILWAAAFSAVGAFLHITRVAAYARIVEWDAEQFV